MPSNNQQPVVNIPPPATTPALPPNNTYYAKKSYWEERFQTEESYEWLLSYTDVAEKLALYLPLSKTDPILVVGCGNSSFSHDLYEQGGYTNITSIDYSVTVIAAMKEKYPLLTWVCADMTKLTTVEGSGFCDGCFGCVIDKAAMDALMSEEGDVWNPESSVVETCWDMCVGVSRVLKEGGFHLQISFAQPHFRNKYLLGEHKEGGSLEDLGWELSHETVFGEDSVFGHFLYIMKKGGKD